MFLCLNPLQFWKTQYSALLHIPETQLKHTKDKSIGKNKID